MRVKSGYFKNREQEMELFFNTPKLNWLLYSDPIKKPRGKNVGNLDRIYLGDSEKKTAREFMTSRIWERKSCKMQLFFVAN